MSGKRSPTKRDAAPAPGGPEAESWKLTLPCTKAEAEALPDDIPAFALLDPTPAVMASEIDASEPDKWRLDVYFEEEPADWIVAEVRRLVPSAARARAEVSKLPPRDWVTVSQQGLEPIEEGRFFVHIPQHADDAPDEAIPIEIDASRAFGTGQHETTAGCLAMLDGLKARGERFHDIADIGTGTGLLAFAAMALWPHARTIASDIDPLAIEIAEENAGINGVPIGAGPGRLELVVATGLVHRRLRARAPYDLIVANILAKPLIDLAPAIANALAPGGSLILAGLLNHQAEAVAAAYRARHFRLVGRIERGDWTILRLRKRRRVRGHRPASRA